jgi:uncharacterized protein
MTHNQFELYSRSGEILRADLRYMPTGEAKPAIIFMHGFKGFKDWGPFPAMLEELANSGFVTLAFNFSHNGIGDDLMNFTELDRFAENTFTRELEEVGDVVRAVAACESIPISPVELDPNAIGLLGHSRGAAMSILSGSKLRQVQCVAALSPVSTVERYSERAKKRWREQGTFDVLNQRTKQVMSLNVTLLDDLEQHSEELNILNAAAEYPKLQKPLMLVCGSEDLTTPLKETHLIVEAARGPLTELQIIPHAGHTFNAVHPFQGWTEPLKQVIEVSKAFFAKSLKV